VRIVQDALGSIRKVLGHGVLRNGGGRHQQHQSVATIYACGLWLSEGVGLPVMAVDSTQMLLNISGSAPRRKKPYLLPHSMSMEGVVWVRLDWLA
jgi:hypothetical protein